MDHLANNDTVCTCEICGDQWDMAGSEIKTVCDECQCKVDGTMEFVNKHGNRYVVKLHKNRYTATHEPVVAFHFNGQHLDSPGLYAYYVSTLLERPTGLGLWLDGANEKATVDAETMDKVREFATKEAEEKFGWLAEEEV